MTSRAQGTFEVQLTPQEPGDQGGDATLGRLTIDKQFRGDLEATSRGEMLTAVLPSRARRVTSRWSW